MQLDSRSRLPEVLVSADTPPSESVTSGTAEAQWLLPRTARSAHRARGLLRTQLTEWKVDDDTACTAELLLSELVSNSVRHARTPPGRDIGVRVAWYGGRLRVEVADADDTRPNVRKADGEDEQGRGLAIIEALAARWGCCPRRYGIGKATWAEVALPDGAQPR
ncbi:ATP-binding protein [Streptomyces sp. NBC_00820]|uniref:ATP-binding protein n=1 Tax=Streptomyces sp. NBC_00820 TaxID=2975842 RepID=UPI002ED6AA2C|nr:ATP-binding protein [Streptomyces sp. NBC_00820]